MNESDAQNMQSYPSPSAITADNSGPFYTSAPQTNHDDLQLAEQLTRGIAPMMNTSGGMPDGEEQSRQSNHQYESQAHAPNLRSPNESMDQMSMQFSTQEGSLTTRDPRKRSKVSRACDECRRKKIKCDATADPQENQGDEGTVVIENCSSCRRVGTTCQFSRVPQKRGPSKGYIKELADRLHALEEQTLQPGEMPVPQYLPQQNNSPSRQHRGSEDFSPSVDSMGRKRTFSSVSGDFSSPYQPQRAHAGWAPQDTPRGQPHLSSSFSTAHPPPTAQMYRDKNNPLNGLQPSPQWRNPPEPTRQQGSSFESITQIDQGSSDFNFNWDDSIVDSYYDLIHPTYPLLSLSKTHLNFRMMNCAIPLKDALYEALHDAVQSFTISNKTSPKQLSTKRATQLIATSRMENVSARPLSTNLIYLQIILLMAIEAANSGPATAEAPGCSLQSVWLGDAVRLAYGLKLHTFTATEKSSEDDVDSDDEIARRLWWSLAIMDRWHASSSATPTLTPESSTILCPEDQVLLGDSVYHLARLSMVLGHFSAIELVPGNVPALTLPPTPILSSLMRGELERCRETFPSSILESANAPTIHFSYWALSIMMLVRLSESEPVEILAPALNIVNALSRNPSMVGPLIHHAVTIAALALADLTKYEATQEQAVAGLKTLMEGRITPLGWDSAIRAISKRALGEVGPPGSLDASTGHALVAAQGLQHLADLATKEGKGGNGGVSAGESRNDSDIAATSPARPQQFRGLRGAVKTGYLSNLAG